MAYYQLNTNQTGKILHIRSLDIPQSEYIGGLTTDFNVILDDPITCNQNEHIIMSLDSLSVPMVFYNVDNTTNLFRFVEDGINRGILVFPIGNYTMKSIASQLATLLNNNSPGGRTYTVDYGSFKNDLTITVSPATVSFTIAFDVQSACFTQLGFQEDSINTSVGGVLRSVNSCSLIKYLSLYLCTDLALGCSLNTRGKLTNILERVSITAPNSLMYFRPTSTSKKFILKDRTINRFRLRLLFDLEDTPVNLRGNHIECSLQFHIVSGLDRPLVDNTRPEYPLIPPPPTEAEETTFQ